MEQLPGYTPQAISDILPIYRPQDTEGHVRDYSLRQTSTRIQTLATKDESIAAPIYTIKTFKTGGFMNRNPHVIISTGSGEKCQVAEARFDIHGKGTTINYLGTPKMQRLDLENSQTQLIRTAIHGATHWWQPFPGNKNVLELTNEMEDTVARFIYAEPVSRITGEKTKAINIEIGELHIVDDLAGGDTGRKEILCSAAVVIERAKRRAANIAYKGGVYIGGAGRTMSASSAGGYIPQ